MMLFPVFTIFALSAGFQLTKINIGNTGKLPLAIETGRYSKPKTPLQDRLCKFCSSNSIEDETHFLADCDFYSDLRYDLIESASPLNANFHFLNSEGKICFLMESDELQFNIANYLLAAFRRRRHAKL